MDGTAATALVEREREKALLSERLGRLARGSGSGVLVEGAMGIGKSALLLWAVDTAAGAGATVLWARASRLGENLHAGVLRDWFAKCARRLPEGTPPFDGPGAVLREGGASAEELAYAVRWVLDDMTREGPVVLAVDDVQWADPVSVAVITDLLHHVADLGCFVLVAQRTGGDVVRSIVDTSLDPQVAVVRLGPLSPAGTVRLIGDVDDATAHDVVARSAGNPLFALRLAESLRHGEAVPDGLVDVIADQLEGLDPQAQEVARVLAVLCSVSGAASLEVLVRTWGGSTTAARRLLERLRRTGLVELRGTWRLAHPLMTDAVLGTLDDDALARWHARAARSLDAAQDVGDPALGHWLRTRPAGSRALQGRLERGGRDALEGGNAHTASRYLVRAVQEREPTAQDVGLLTAAASALARCDRMDEAVAMWERAVGLCPGNDEVGQVLAAAGDDLVEMGKIPEAVELFRRWGALVEGGGGTRVEQAQAQFVARSRLMGYVLGEELGDLPAMLGRVLSQDPDRDSHADRLVLSAAAVEQCFSPQGDAVTARAFAVRSWAGGRLLDEETADSGPLYLVTAALNWSDTFEVALDVLDGAIAEARSQGWMMPLATAAYCRAFVRLRAGDVLGALADVAVTRELRRLGWDAYVSPLLACWVQCLRARGEEIPQEVVDELVGRADRGTPFLDIFAVDTLATIHLDAGRADLARPFVERALEMIPSVSSSPAITPVGEVHARLLLAEGDGARAREIVAGHVARARTWGAPRCVAETLVAQIRIEHGARGADETADDLIASALEAIALTERLPDVLARSAAQVVLGELWVVRGPRGQGAPDGAPTTTAEVVAHVQAAHVKAGRQGLEPLVRRASSVLAQLGTSVPAWRPASGLLSAAERRVVDLAVGGMTNREIAAELFVTLKTVEWHLSSSYRKLGIRSRSDLPGALATLVPVDSVDDAGARPPRVRRSGSPARG